MKNRPIHENLDTSFVNLSALVKYLRRRQFVGGIRVELSGYDADVTLTAENQIKVREHDRIAGRIAEGEEALQRLLIRAREPGGVIHVYQNVEETEESVIEKAGQIIKEKDVVVQTTQAFANINQTHLPQNAEAEIISDEKSTPAGNLSKPSLKLPKFPFELSNKVEAKAKQTEISAPDWQILIGLTAELLDTIDKVLAEANLDFPSAFEKARIDVSADYPFLNPTSGVFDYKDGKISMDEQINATLFVTSINETLRRIFEKLGNNPKFADAYRAATQSILALIHQRKPLYDKFSITPQIEKIVGI